MKTRILLLLGLLVVGAGGFYLYEMATRSHDDLAQVNPDYRLSATDLYAKFSQNEAEATAQYVGKTIEVSGTVSGSETSPDGEAVLMVAAEGEPFGLSCSFADLPNPLPQAGAAVTVRGVCTGYLMDVNLVRCVLL